LRLAAAPIMAPGMISLVVSGLAGITIMWGWAGRWGTPLLGVEQHWTLMIFGFFAALIGNEVLNLLSIEWSGRFAPPWLSAASSLAIWGVLASALLGSVRLAHAFFGVFALLLTAYAWRVYLRPSRIGLRPTTYNKLLVANLALSAALAFAAASDAPIDPAIAALVFPVGTIYAVMARDISVVLGGKPVPQSLNAAAYALVVAALVLWSLEPVIAFAKAVAGLLMVASSIVSLGFSGVIRGARAARMPTVLQLYTAYAWSAVAGALLLIGAPGLWIDVAIHALTLGFIFDIVFGVDIILLELLLASTGSVLGTIRVRTSSRGIVELQRLVPYVLLNLGLLLRIAYAASQIDVAAVASGPLVGAGIILFMLMTLRKVITQAH